jgi:hypothetical protein
MLANQAADKPIKAFICAGQSNMVGWGDSTKLSDGIRKGNERVLMFEDGKWQPLRPHEANHAPVRAGLHLGGMNQPSFRRVLPLARRSSATRTQSTWRRRTIRSSTVKASPFSTGRNQTYYGAVPSILPQAHPKADETGPAGFKTSQANCTRMRGT